MRLSPSDLIDDREVIAVADDRLAHEGIVEQLAALTKSVATPSNIALYGPWGSGKSGIANLLKNQVDRKEGVRFVRFDAFKYADVPLRRNFISAIAKELRREDSKYHDDLYSGRTKTEITVPPATLFKLLGMFGLLLCGLTVIITALVALIALGQSRLGEQTGDFPAALKSLSRQALLAGLLPAALLSALVALASKTFNVDRSVAKPDSDEQFEALFRDLVRDCGAQRLVIFIDELDRCSADEVVATLDTIRTFLGIERCVFIVAADQNVLEEALTRSAKQKTPNDDANPYYSTGSAYLDKVFQYQLSLPPLLTQSVSNYAKTLVEDRAGLWRDIRQDYVLSVLIPTHVTSPRRVKHLLNTFALTYRLAEERHRIGLLAESPATSAAAIARLVCLRVEFPLFARYLEVDANLPRLVLRLIQHPDADFPSTTSPRAVELARSYALNDAAPGTLLSQDEPADNVAGGEDDDGEDANKKSQAIKAHNKQLLNYLSRTRQVPGPSRDLIYMQSTGTEFGLDGQIALAIESAAEDADIEELARLIGDLDEAEQRGALQLLANLIRTGNGLTAPNAARSFLLLSDRLPDLDISAVVDTIAEDISGFEEEEASDVLDEDTFGSAWRLAKTGTEAGALELRKSVLAAAMSNDTNPPEFLYQDTVRALDSYPAVMPRWLAAQIVSTTGPGAVARLFTLNDADLLTTLQAIRDPLAKSATAAFKARTAWTANAQAATPTPARTSTTAATPEPEPEPFDPQGIVDALQDKAADRETPVQHETLRLLLNIDHQDARTAAKTLIHKTEAATDSPLVESILRSTNRRVRAEWPTWLAGVAPDAITPAHGQPVQNLVDNLWAATGDPAGTRQAVLTSLQPLIDALPDDHKPDVQAKANELVEPFVSDSDEAKARLESIDKARAFATVGAVDFNHLLNLVAVSLQDTLAAKVAPVDSSDPLYRYTVDIGREALTACEIDAAMVNSILNEAAVSPWLDDLGHIQVPLELARAAGNENTDVDALPNAQAVADLISNHGRQAAHAVTLWTQLVNPNPQDFATIYNALAIEKAFTDELIAAANTSQNTWDTDEHYRLLEQHLAAPEADLPERRALQALGIANADETLVADLLCARFAGASNNMQRQNVIHLWEQANIRDGAVKRRLIETVIYGLLDLHTATGGNAGAVDIALNALNTLGHPLPYGPKTALGHRVKNAVNGNKPLEDKSLRVMTRLGYTTTSGWFKKRSFNPDS